MVVLRFFPQKIFELWASQVCCGPVNLLTLVSDLSIRESLSYAAIFSTFC